MYENPFLLQEAAPFCARYVAGVMSRRCCASFAPHCSRSHHPVSEYFFSYKYFSADRLRPLPHVKVWQIGKDEQAVQAKPEELGDPSIMPTIYILHLSLFWLHLSILTKARYLAIILDTFYHIFYFDSNIRQIRHPRLTR